MKYIVANATKVNILCITNREIIVPENFDLATFLPYELAYISERVSHRLSQVYGQSHGFSVSEWRVMVNLQSLGTASVRDIQTFTNLEKSRVSRAVTRLEAADLVQKHASTNDARLVEIALTAKGTEALEVILPTATAVEANLLAGLTQAQKATFFDVLQHFHDVLDQDPEARPRFALSTTASEKPTQA